MSKHRPRPGRRQHHHRHRHRRQRHGTKHGLRPGPERHCAQWRRQRFRRGVRRRHCAPCRRQRLRRGFRRRRGALRLGHPPPTTRASPQGRGSIRGSHARVQGASVLSQRGHSPIVAATAAVGLTSGMRATACIGSPQSLRLRPCWRKLLHLANSSPWPTVSTHSYPRGRVRAQRPRPRHRPEPRLHSRLRPTRPRRIGEILPRSKRRGRPMNM